MTQIIGVVGFIGSGKDTVGDMLCDLGFKRDSFAAPLKDAVAIIFGWDRNKLDGKRKEDREWRDIKDEYWSEALGKLVTPRLALQWMGTEAGRNVFGQSLWTASCINRIWLDRPNSYVVTDVRFDNEIEALDKVGALIIRIHRGPEPSYFEAAREFNDCKRLGVPMRIAADKYIVDEAGKPVHQSEWDWVGNSKIRFNISNNGSIEELHAKVLMLTNIANGK